jgi:hypothetical protein
VLALAAAGLLWRRASTPAARFANLPSALPRLATPPPSPPGRPTAATPVQNAARVATPPPVPPGRSTAATPIQNVAVSEDSDAVRSQVTPAMGSPSDPAVPAVVARERTLSGRVDISLARSGSVSVSPRAPRTGPAGSSWPIDPNAPKDEPDPHAEEYRALFAEFVKVRRTTGESVEGLDVTHFVATLSAKRAEIMKQIPVKDVRFKLAFQNGKAAIRFLTVS